MTFTKAVWHKLLEIDTYLDGCSRSLNHDPVFTDHERKVLQKVAASIESSAAMLNLYAALNLTKKKKS